MDSSAYSGQVVVESNTWKVMVYMGTVVSAKSWVVVEPSMMVTPATVEGLYPHASAVTS